MYAPVTGVDAASYTSAMRVRRLNKEKNNWLLGILMDLIFGAGPWVLGVVIAARTRTIPACLCFCHQGLDAAKQLFTRTEGHRAHRARTLELYIASFENAAIAQVGTKIDRTKSPPL